MKPVLLSIFLCCLLGCEGVGNSSSSSNSTTSTEFNQPVECNVSCQISVDTGFITAAESCEGVFNSGDEVSEGVCSTFIEETPREEELDT